MIAWLISCGTFSGGNIADMDIDFESLYLGFTLGAGVWAICFSAAFVIAWVKHLGMTAGT